MKSSRKSLLSMILVLALCLSMLSGCSFELPDFGFGPADNTETTGPADNTETTGPADNTETTGPVDDGGNTETTGPVGDETPDVPAGNSASADVTADADNKVSAAVSMSSNDGTIGADVPTGVKLAEGASELTLNVSDVADSEANITLGENEVSKSIDVHMDGVAADNDVVMAIVIKALLAKGLNMGNYRFYHVENGETVEMTLLAADATPVHNNYAYDPATGDVVLYLKSFSEVVYTENTENAWNGDVDHSWYKADATELTIANADQLWSFSQIVGGMAEGIEQDSFAGKTVKLIANINLGDKESENNPDLIFYPIGYYNSEGTYERTNTAITSGMRNFEGTFDGNGNTIANFYHNTWEMKGDHDWYSPEEQYYRDGMGLFGRVYKGTVKNLTVKNFSSDGEIATTGVIAAYADGATFENIAIINCNPRVYNIGNGGIVGCVGWYAKEEGLKTTFKNVTVDNSNKISALWGSYDVACGGIVGQYYPTSGQTSAGEPKNGGIEFTNCHVAAQMDVYNDVCANYQYYAYRYTGMMIGSIRENETINGHVYPKMDGITAIGCTVHFGDWNDYYYCELVANSLASYTHDHQMSRLTQVEKLNSETKKYLPLGAEDKEENWVAIPADGRVNYVVVKAKDNDGMWIHGDGENYATCYHFVDGNVWNHEDAGTETVNGVEGVLKEDKQLVYREFNQLFTGYGWGVTSKGLTDYEGVENMDITHSDNEESVEKFKPKDGVAGKDFCTGTTVVIDDLFVAIENADIAIKSDNVQVFVSPADSNSTVSGTYEANTNDWTQGTLTLSGSGKAIISITDYNYCKTATLEINVVAWTLVTNESSPLKADDKVVIACVTPDAEGNYYAMGAQADRIRLAAVVTKNGNTIAFGDDTGVQILTLENGLIDGTFAFQTGAGYLRAWSTTANQLSILAKMDENCSWVITIVDGTTTIQAQGSNKRNYLGYSNSVFTCYNSASINRLVEIYRCNHGHYETWDVSNDVPATCTTDGSKTYTCSNCKDTRTDTLSATGHTYDENGNCSCGKNMYEVTYDFAGVTCAKGGSVKLEGVTITSTNGSYIGNGCVDVYTGGSVSDNTLAGNHLIFEFDNAIKKIVVSHRPNTTVETEYAWFKVAVSEDGITWTIPYQQKIMGNAEYADIEIDLGGSYKYMSFFAGTKRSFVNKMVVTLAETEASAAE